MQKKDVLSFDYVFSTSYWTHNTDLKFTNDVPEILIVPILILR